MKIENWASSSYHSSSLCGTFATKKLPVLRTSKDLVQNCSGNSSPALSFPTLHRALILRTSPFSVLTVHKMSISLQHQLGVTNNNIKNRCQLILIYVYSVNAYVKHLIPKGWRSELVRSHTNHACKLDLIASKFLKGNTEKHRLPYWPTSNSTIPLHKNTGACQETLKLEKYLSPIHLQSLKMSDRWTRTLVVLSQYNVKLKYSIPI